MNSWKKMALGLGLALAFSSPALAQGQGRGGFGGMGGNLLANESVQKELKIDDAQKEKITKFSTEQREKMQALGQDATPDERREAMTAMQASSKKFVTENLKPEQAKRYRQIQLQTMGAQAFNDPEVVSALKLTDDQKAKIKSINEDTMAKMQDLRQDFQNDREGAMKKMAEIRNETTTKVLGVLTSEQKATWKDLTGAPFTLVQQQRRRDA